jgi:hypothetical protein
MEDKLKDARLEAVSELVGKKGKKKVRWSDIIWFAVTALVVLAIYAAVGYAIYRYWRIPWEWLVRAAESPNDTVRQVGPALGLLGIAAAFLLYLLRSAARLHYGLTEIMFGVVFVLAATMNASRGGEATAIVQIAGGVFFIVRGLDNVKNGLDEQPNHRFWRVWNMMYSEEKIDRVRRRFGTPLKRG